MATNKDQVGKGARPKQLTTKGAELLLQTQEKAFKAEHKKFRVLWAGIDSQLKDDKSPTVDEVTNLQETLQRMSQVCSELSNTFELETYQSVHDTYTKACTDHDELVKRLNINKERTQKKADDPPIENVSTQNGSEEIKETSTTALQKTNDDAESVTSRRTRRSHTTVRSRRTESSSFGPEALAHAAALRAKLKYADEEAEHRVEIEKAKSRLNKLQLARELDMVEAGLQAVEEFERDGSDRCSSVPSKVKLDRIKTFLDTQNPQQDEPEGDPIPIVEEFVPSRILDDGHLNSAAEPEVNHVDLDDHMTMRQLIQTLSDQATLSRLPPPEPTVFMGDPLKYPQWISAIRTLIDRRGIPSTEKLHYLKRYLAGEAREAVEGHFLLTTSDAYDQVIQILHKRYGDSFVVAGAFRDKLEKWPKVQSRDRLGLCKFSDFLNQCRTAMISIPSLSILNDDRENARMLIKLPEWLVNRWARNVAFYKNRNKAFPPFKEFAEFVRTEADIACDPVTSLESIKETTVSHNRSRSRAVGAGNFAVDSKEEKTQSHVKSNWKAKCILCRQEHYIDHCEMFLKKSVLSTTKGSLFWMSDPGAQVIRVQKKKDLYSLRQKTSDCTTRYVI